MHTAHYSQDFTWAVRSIVFFHAIEVNIHRPKVNIIFQEAE